MGAVAQPGGWHRGDVPPIACEGRHRAGIFTFFCKVLQKNVLSYLQSEVAEEIRGEN